MIRQTDRPRPPESRGGLPVRGAAPHGPRVVRRRHTRTWLALALAVLAIVAGTVLWRLQHSSYFLVDQVQITGTKMLDPQRVAAAAGVVGRQFYQIDSASVAQAVERLPYVQTAQVKKIWPHTVQIAITERQPWGTWQIGGTNYLVDQQGTVLDIVSRSSARTIYDLDAAPGLQPGEHVDADTIKAASELFQELPAFVSQQVAKLEYSSDGGLVVITNRGVQARLGGSQGLDYKLAVWQAVNAKVGAGQVHLIDLRFGNRPYFR